MVAPVKEKAHDAICSGMAQIRRRAARCARRCEQRCVRVLGGTRGLRRAVLAFLLVVASVVRAHAVTYYVRQTVGDDTRDGRSAATAWRTLARLSSTLKAGDTVYVGPG